MLKTLKLYEILVPMNFPDSTKISTEWHQKWDEKVCKISKGLTIFGSSISGRYFSHGKVVTDDSIAVRIACTPEEILKIAEITLKHYKQEAFIYYSIGEAFIYVSE